MKKQLTEEMLIDWWLEKYHNTNLVKVQAEHPDWSHGNPDYNSLMFYAAYPVTQEQHDEWLAWAKEAYGKHFRLSKKRVDKAFAFTYLNVSPNIIES